MIDQIDINILQIDLQITNNTNKTMNNLLECLNKLQYMS